MNPLERISRLEGDPAREHLVERDAERIEVGARVDRPVHSPRLLRRHVRQRALDLLRALRRRVLAGKPGRDSEIGELRLARRGLDDDVRGFDVLVDDAMPVDVRDGGRDTNREPQKALRLHRRPEQAVEGRAGHILQDERRLPVIRIESERPDDGREVQRLGERLLVLQSFDVLRPAALRIERFEDHPAAIAFSDGAEHEGPPTLEQGLGDRVRGGMLHLHDERAGGGARRG